MHRSLYFIYFLSASSLTLLTPLFKPSLSLNFFAPFLLLILYKKGRSFALSQAFICGCILDLLAAENSFGFWTLNLIVTIFLISLFKHLFFAEKVLTLPFLTLIFSWISTTLYFLMTNIFCYKTHLTLQWALTDLILLPIFDGFYALVVFSLPLVYLSRLLPSNKRQTSSLNLKEN